MDLITELSGLDSKYAMSAKLAASEILRGGSPLFDLVLKTALAGDKPANLRCAEACARAAVRAPAVAAKRSKEIISAIISRPRGNMRYFLCVMLQHARVTEKQAEKCAKLIRKWLRVETGLGARACFLETIYCLAKVNSKMKPMFESLLNEALKSPIPSFSARARQIIMKMGKK